MTDLKAVEQALNNYIRPLTFPVAIKMLKSEDEIPEKTRRPFQQMKKRWLSVRESEWPESWDGPWPWVRKTCSVL